MKRVICPQCGDACGAPEEARKQLLCPGCKAPLTENSPPQDSTSRVWALLIAAAILYVPANLLPIFDMELVGRPSSDTILGGIAALFASGMWFVGGIVFLASIVIPLLKILGLSFLLISTSRLGSVEARLASTRLYRAIESIGPWSMIDVFVVSLTISLVQFGRLASFSAGPGAACFAVVVVLTIMAARSFDPHTLWAIPEEKR